MLYQNDQRDEKRVFYLESKKDEADKFEYSSDYEVPFGPVAEEVVAVAYKGEKGLHAPRKFREISWVRRFWYYIFKESFNLVFLRFEILFLELKLKLFLENQKKYLIYRKLN